MWLRELTRESFLALAAAAPGATPAASDDLPARLSASTMSSCALAVLAGDDAGAHSRDWTALDDPSGRLRDWIGEVPAGTVRWFLLRPDSYLAATWDLPAGDPTATDRLIAALHDITGHATKSSTTDDSAHRRTKESI